MQSFFVSSTFKDMQGERDALHRIVMPRLRDKARSCGEAVQFVDLRWGISITDLDSEAGADKILSVCLGEIKGCKPYMIVLLGERYGWMPSPDLLQHTAEKMHYRAESYEMSVTELEIRYGMWLASGDLDRCIFCLRDPVPADGLTQSEKDIYLPVSSADKRRMDALRQRITSTPGARVLHYSLQHDGAGFTGYDQFADRLAAQLEELLTPLWQAHSALSWQQRQREEDDVVISQHLAGFVGRERELQQLADLSARHQLVVVEGEGGCGKSALLASLAHRLQRQRRADMFCCGASSSCMTAAQLMRMMLWQLGQYSGNAALTAAADCPADVLRQTFDAQLAAYDGPAATLFIDAIDQLGRDADLFESRFIPPVISPRLHLVVSTTGAVRIDPLALPNGQGASSSAQYCLLPPDESDLRQILTARFAAEHKQVSAAVADRILQNPCSKNMLGMEIMVRRLVMLDARDFAKIADLEKTAGGSAAIDAYLLQLVDGMRTGLNDLITGYFYDVCRFLADREKDVDRMRMPLYLIGITRHGISVGHLEGLAHFGKTEEALSGLPDDHIWKTFWDPILFARMRLYMGPLLTQRPGGCIDFSHRLLRQAVLADRSSNDLCLIMRLYLLYQPQAEDLRLENILPFNRAAEWCMMVGTKDHELDFDAMEGFFHHIIADSAALADSDDETEAAEGARQMRMLEQSILEDIDGPDSDNHLQLYSLFLMNGIENGYGAGRYSVWFFASRIAAALEKRGDAGKAQALQLLCAVLSALHRQRDAYLAGDKSFAKNWQQPSGLLLLYHTRALRLYSELRPAQRRGEMQLAHYEGMSPEILFEKTVALADEYIAADPDKAYLYWFRKGCANVYLAAYMTDTVVGFGRNPREKYVQEAFHCGKQALEAAVRLQNPAKVRSSAANLLYLVSLGCQVLVRVSWLQVLGTRGVVQRAWDMCRQALQLVEAQVPFDSLAVQDRARFACVCADCMERCAAGKNADSLRQQAQDLRGRTYMAIAADGDRQLTGKDREYMAQLGADIGLNLVHKWMPTAMEQAGYDLSSAAGLLVEREGGYLQAQARTDFESRWLWACMLVLEAYYHAGINRDLCLAACGRARQVLQDLLPLTEKYIDSVQVTKKLVQVQLDLVNRLQSL